MSCDLLLCPCYVIALRMLCFCFALIIYCKLQARYRPYTFEDKMRTFSQVYTVAYKEIPFVTLMRFYEPLK